MSMFALRGAAFASDCDIHFYIHLRIVIVPSQMYFSDTAMYLTTSLKTD